jgi:hypothetical protein
MLAVDFDHATWFMVVHVSAADSEQGGKPYERGQKQLHVVSFPGVEVRSGIGGPVDPVGRSLSASLQLGPGSRKRYEVEMINIEREYPVHLLGQQ